MCTSGRGSFTSPPNKKDNGPMMKRLVSLSSSLLSASLAVFCCLCLLLATERRAYAYIDPGQGMMALQSLGALLATAGYVLRRRIAALFGRSRAPETPVEKIGHRVVLPSAARADSKRSAA